MKVEREDILNLFLEEVKSQFKKKLKKIILFGSRARVDYKQDSDYDILLVFDYVTKKEEDFIEDLTSKILIEYGVLISVVMLNYKEFNRMKFEPFIINIKKEGILLWEKKELELKDIIKRLKEKKEFLKKYNVKRIGIFGSYTKGNQCKKSDIDFFVEFNLSNYDKNFKGLFDDFMALELYLRSLFKRKVDILTYESLKTIRVKEIKEDIKKNLIYVWKKRLKNL